MLTTNCSLREKCTAWQTNKRKRQKSSRINFDIIYKKMLINDCFCRKCNTLCYSRYSACRIIAYYCLRMFCFVLIFVTDLFHVTPYWAFDRRVFACVCVFIVLTEQVSAFTVHTKCEYKETMILTLSFCSEQNIVLILHNYIVGKWNRIKITYRLYGIKRETTVWDIWIPYPMRPIHL